MNKLIFLFSLLLFSSMTLMSQNWTDDNGRPAGERSGGSRYYTVDRGAVTQRLSAWLRTHTQQIGGEMSCNSDWNVTVRLQDADIGSSIIQAKKGVPYKLEIANYSPKKIYFAVAMIDENENWSVLATDQNGKSYGLDPKSTCKVPCSFSENVSKGKGNILLLAYSEPFYLSDVIELYLKEYLYERNVKAGGALYHFVVVE